jgi:hypothetical protein
MKEQKNKVIWLFLLVLFMFTMLPGLAKWYLDTRYPDNPKARIETLDVRHDWQIAGAGADTPVRKSTR